MTRRDLGRADLEPLLRDFYGRVFADELLRPVFVGVAHMDLEQHLPVIAAFWDKVLFNTDGYAGRPLDVHRRIARRVPFTDELFDRWLALWRESLDALYAGPVAEQAYAHASRMARVFARHLAEVPADRRTLDLVRR